MDIYIDGVLYAEGVSGRNLASSERRREIYLLNSLNYGAHTAKVVVTAGTFVMDGLMYIGDIYGLRNELNVTSNLSVDSVFANADLNTILPATVTVSGWANGVPVEDMQLPVVWTLTDISNRLFGSASIAGVVTNGENTIPVNFAINMILPAKAVYFISAGSSAATPSSWAAIAGKYPNLLNARADQASGGNNTTVGTNWGWAAGNNGNPVASGAANDDIFTSFRYGATNGTNENFHYDLPISAAGEYGFSFGFYQTWANRNLSVTARVYTADGTTQIGNSVTLISSVTSSTTPTAVSATNTVTIDGPCVIRLTFQRVSGDAPTVSWIGAYEIALKPSLTVNYTGFTQLVYGSAANIPVVVDAVNPDNLPVYAGLFVDDVMLVSAPVVDGKVTLRAPAIKGDSAYILAWAEENGDPVMDSKKDIPLVGLPDNLWAPSILATGANETRVLFAAKIAFTATATVTIDGVATTDFEIDGDNMVKIAVETVAGQTIVIKGLKYPTLYPSYSFTFTLVK